MTPPKIAKLSGSPSMILQRAQVWVIQLDSFACVEGNGYLPKIGLKVDFDLQNSILPTSWWKAWKV